MSKPFLENFISYFSLTYTYSCTHCNVSCSDLSYRRGSSYLYTIHPRTLCSLHPSLGREAVNLFNLKKNNTSFSLNQLNMLQYIQSRLKTVIVKKDDPSLAVTHCCVYNFQIAKCRCEYNL